MRKLMIFGLLGLAACATPQEQCISNAGKDLRVFDQLIRTTQGNLARGFALEDKTVFVNTDQVCGVDAEGNDVICEVAVAEEERVAVAIDLDEEQRKLNSLMAAADCDAAQRQRPG